MNPVEKLKLEVANLRQKLFIAASIRAQVEAILRSEGCPCAIYREPEDWCGLCKIAALLCSAKKASTESEDTGKLIRQQARELGNQDCEIENLRELLREVRDKLKRSFFPQENFAGAEIWDFYFPRDFQNRVDEALAPAEGCVTPDTWAWADKVHDDGATPRTHSPDALHAESVALETENAGLKDQIDDLRNQLEKARAFSRRQGRELGEKDLEIERLLGVISRNGIRPSAIQSFYTVCPKCHLRHPTLWTNVVWNEGDTESARFKCPSCAAEFCGAWRTLPQIVAAYLFWKRDPQALKSFFIGELGEVWMDSKINHSPDAGKMVAESNCQGILDSSPKPDGLMKELLESLKWSIATIQGSSGAAHTYWVDVPGYREALAAIARAEGRGA